MGHSPTMRIGQLLVRSGAMTEEQVAQVLNEQKDTGRPFGDLAERLFGVSPDVVEQAWIDQYMEYDTCVDLNTQTIDMEVLRVLNRRQAWQFRMLPLRREQGELLAVTSRDKLTRAVNFAWRRLHDPVFFLIAQRPQLEQFLMEHYPWPAMEENNLALVG